MLANCLFVTLWFFIWTFDSAKLLSEITEPLQNLIEFSFHVNLQFQRSYFTCHCKFISIFIVPFRFSIILSLLKICAWLHHFKLNAERNIAAHAQTFSRETP